MRVYSNILVFVLFCLWFQSSSTIGLSLPIKNVVSDVTPIRPISLSYICNSTIAPLQSPLLNLPITNIDSNKLSCSMPKIESFIPSSEFSPGSNAYEYQILYSDLDLPSRLNSFQENKLPSRSLTSIVSDSNYNYFKNFCPVLPSSDTSSSCLNLFRENNLPAPCLKTIAASTSTEYNENLLPEKNLCVSPLSIIKPVNLLDIPSGKYVDSSTSSNGASPPLLNPIKLPLPEDLSFIVNPRGTSVPVLNSFTSVLPSPSFLQNVKPTSQLDNLSLKPTPVDLLLVPSNDLTLPTSGICEHSFQKVSSSQSVIIPPIDKTLTSRAPLLPSIFTIKPTLQTVNLPINLNNIDSPTVYCNDALSLSSTINPPKIESPSLSMPYQILKSSESTSSSINSFKLVSKYSNVLSHPPVLVSPPIHSQNSAYHKPPHVLGISESPVTFLSEAFSPTHLNSYSDQFSFPQQRAPQLAPNNPYNAHITKLPRVTMPVSNTNLIASSFTSDYNMSTRTNDIPISRVSSNIHETLINLPPVNNSLILPSKPFHNGNISLHPVTLPLSPINSCLNKFPLLKNQHIPTSTSSNYNFVPPSTNFISKNVLSPSLSSEVSTKISLFDISNISSRLPVKPQNTPFATSVKPESTLSLPNSFTDLGSELKLPRLNLPSSSINSNYYSLPPVIPSLKSEFVPQSLKQSIFRSNSDSETFIPLCPTQKPLINNGKEDNLKLLLGKNIKPSNDNRELHANADLKVESSGIPIYTASNTKSTYTNLNPFQNIVISSTPPTTNIAHNLAIKNNIYPNIEPHLTNHLTSTSYPYMPPSVNPINSVPNSIIDLISLKSTVPLTSNNALHYAPGSLPDVVMSCNSNVLPVNQLTNRVPISIAETTSCLSEAYPRSNNAVYSTPLPIISSCHALPSNQLTNSISNNLINSCPISVEPLNSNIAIPLSDVSYYNTVSVNQLPSLNSKNSLHYVPLSDLYQCDKPPVNKFTNSILNFNIDTGPTSTGSLSLNTIQYTPGLLSDVSYCNKFPIYSELPMNSIKNTPSSTYNSLSSPTCDFVDTHSNPRICAPVALQYINTCSNTSPNFASIVNEFTSSLTKTILSAALNITSPTSTNKATKLRNNQQCSSTSSFYNLSPVVILPYAESNIQSALDISSSTLSNPFEKSCIPNSFTTPPDFNKPFLSNLNDLLALTSLLSKIDLQQIPNSSSDILSSLSSIISPFTQISHENFSNYEIKESSSDIVFLESSADAAPILTDVKHSNDLLTEMLLPFRANDCTSPSFLPTPVLPSFSTVTYPISNIKDADSKRLEDLIKLIIFSELFGNDNTCNLDLLEKIIVLLSTK